MADINLTNPESIIRAEQLLKAIESLRAELPQPVDVSSLTPSSKYVRNAVIGINGVIYKAVRATQNHPCTMVVQDGKFVTKTVNGKKAFVISDPTPNTDWIVWTDAGIEYWIASISTALDSKQDAISDLATIRQNASQAIRHDTEYRVGNVTYTADVLLQALAESMESVFVTQRQ